jgi:hypothetical protein
MADALPAKPAFSGSSPARRLAPPTRSLFRPLKSSSRAIWKKSSARAYSTFLRVGAAQVTGTHPLISYVVSDTDAVGPRTRARQSTN